VSASDVGADGSEKPRLQAVGRVPTVAAMGSRAPKGAATKHTEQSTHQAAIWAALVYAGTCLSRGSKVTLTIESGTALRNLITAPAGAEAQKEGAAQGGEAAQEPPAAARRGGKTVAGQRQQKAETQPATRSKEREGDGRKGDKRRRRAWPHRTKHQEPDAARGAESEIPRKTGATGAPKGHAYNPAHAGANRGAVRGCFRTRHLHRDGRERQPSGPLVGPDQNMGPGGLATPGTGRCPRVPPNNTIRC